MLHKQQFTYTVVIYRSETKLKNLEGCHDRTESEGNILFKTVDSVYKFGPNSAGPHLPI